jgi:hypothetical protein
MGASLLLRSAALEGMRRCGDGRCGVKKFGNGHRLGTENQRPPLPNVLRSIINTPASVRKIAAPVVC